MAYPSNVVKVTFGGSLFMTNEIWQCGLTLAVPGDQVEMSAAELQALADALGPVVDGYFTEISNSISGAVALQWTKVALLGSDGLYANSVTGIYTTEPEIRGTVSSSGSGGNVLPQASCAVTLDARTRGQRARLSRFYLPMPAAFISITTGRATSLQQTFLVPSAGFIDRVNAAAQRLHPGLVVVAASKLGSGAVNPVKAVRIGDVVDTMRSRRNGLRETYQYQELGAEASE